MLILSVSSLSYVALTPYTLKNIFKRKKKKRKRKLKIPKSYIADEIIDNLEDEEISIKLKDNSSPIIAQENSNKDLVYVLMPMRV